MDNAQVSGPRAYKSRRNRPCDICRARKIACRIDTAPPCSFCFTRAFPCTFVERPSKRKRGTSAVQESQPENTEAEPQINLQNGSHSGTELSISPEFDLTQIDLFSNYDIPEPPTDLPLADNRPIQSTSPIDDIFAGEEWPLDNFSTFARVTADTGHLNRYLMRHYFQDDDRCEFSHTTFRRMNISGERDGLFQDPPPIFEVTEHNLVETAEPRVDKNSLDVAMQEVNMMFTEKQSERLISLFFRFVYPVFPVLSRSWYSSSDSSLISRIRLLPLSLLSCLYATSLPFLLHDDYLYSTLASSHISRERLYRITWLAITEEIHTPRLATLQACLLLLQRGPTNQYLSPTTFKSCLTAWTVSLAKSLGLAYDCSKWNNIPLWERRLRLRLWWAVYTMDKWISLDSGVSSCINSSDFDVPLLHTADPLSTNESLQVPNECAHFYHLVNLSRIIADISDTYFSVQAAVATSHDLFMSLDLARPLRTRLIEWKQACVLDCPLEQQPGADPNSDICLHLAFIVATMTLFRALVRPIGLADNLSSNSSRGNQSGAYNAVYTGALNCVRDAVEFLEKIIALSGPWNAFWHSWSQSNFAIASSFAIEMALSSDVLINGLNNTADSNTFGQTGFSLTETESFDGETGRILRLNRSAGEMLDLINRWRRAMRTGGGSGGWGSSLMSLALLRIDGFMARVEEGA